MVRLYRTFSNYISSGDTRCAGCNMHRFGEVQAHRTFSNFILTEIARYIDFFHMNSAWFDCTKPSPTISLQGIQGVQGAICTGSGRFKHIKPHRTFSNYIFTEIARYIEFFYTSSGWFDWTKPSLTTSLQGIFHTSSGWFDCTEPSPTTSLQEIQGVQGAICTGSGRFKHIEPHRTFSKPRNRPVIPRIRPEVPRNHLTQLGCTYISELGKHLHHNLSLVSISSRTVLVCTE